MPVESAADLLSFMSVDEFGASGRYLSRAGAAATIAGILNDPHLSVDGFGDGPAISEAQPTFVCRAADLPLGAAGGDDGDTIAIAGTDYRVVDIRADGTGLATLILGS